MKEARLALRIVPNAPKNQVAGPLGDALTIKVHAPALDGKANAALILFLAEITGAPRAAIRILTGETARDKTVAIQGLTTDEARALLIGSTTRTPKR